MISLATRLFAESNTKTHRLTEDFFAVLTIVSIIAVVLETVPSLSAYAMWFVIIEWVAVGFFTLEYIGRTLASGSWYRYPTSFFGYIDLISIVPTFLGLGNFTWLKSARALRILRLLRMLRLAKLGRRVGRDEDMSVLSLNIIIYLATLLLALVVTGSALYLVEPQTMAFISIPAGMWWSLQVFLGSIPVIEPATAVGQFLYVLTRFIGLLLLGLLVGVVGNVFRALLDRTN